MGSLKSQRTACFFFGSYVHTAVYFYPEAHKTKVWHCVARACCPTYLDGAREPPVHRVVDEQVPAGSTAQHSTAYTIHEAKRVRSDGIA